MKLFLKKLVLIAMVLVLSAGRGFVQVNALDTYTGDVFDLHIDTNGSNNQGGGLGIYECHYLDQPVSTVNTQGWNLTEGTDAQTIVDYYSSHYTCAGHTPIVGELVAGKYFTGFIVYHVTYWNNGNLKFVGIQASYSLTPPNHAPVANSQIVTTPEDIAKAITLTGSDADGNALSYTVLSDPLHGTLSGTAPNLTYTPAANYNGPDSFTFKVNDGSVDSNIATVSITVGPVNDVPTANNQSLTTNEDVALGIVLTGSDPEGDTLTYFVLTQPGHGLLSGSGSSWTYTPNSNYFGPDSFTFKVNDGLDDSNVATISIDVISVNDAPIADDQNVSTDEDVAKAITLTGSDPDGDSITFGIVTDPTNGILVGDGASWTYTPNLDYTGTDSFTFKVYDGALYSGEATVTITIGGVNDAPTADDQSVSLNEDSNLDITLTGSDPESSTLFYTVLTQPTHGVLTGTGADLNYEPFPNYFGPDSFTFKVSDGTADSNIATVSITVNSVNDAPVADDQTVTTLEDTPKDIFLTGSDIDEDPITFEIKSYPAYGTLDFVTDHWVYTPNPNYNGPDSFTFVANDGLLDSEVATVTINVTAVNDAPVADDSSFNVDEGGQYDGEVTASDPDFMVVPTNVLPASPLMLTYILVDGPTYGSLTFNPDGTYTYIHFGNETTTDSFTFKANDGELDSNVATVSITINPINDAPVASGSAFTVLSGAIYNGTLTAVDPESDPLTFELVTGPAHGALTLLTNGTYAYDHDGLTILADSFTFKVWDGQAYSNTATVTITVTPLPPVNTAPTALPEAFTVVEGGSTDGLVAGADADGDPIVFFLTTDVANGTLTFAANGAYTYTHNNTETTSDSFKFRAWDGKAYSAIQTATITITPVNDAPVAVNGTDETEFETALTGNIHGLASDIDSANWTMGVVSTTTHGTLVLNPDGSFTYTPNTGFSGIDVFTFKANDGTLDSNIALYTITVNQDVVIVTPETPLSPLSFWWAYLLGLLLLLLFFLRPNLKYALVDKNGNEKVIRRHIFANGKDDLFIDLNDKNVEGLVAVDLVVYKQLVKREQGRKITFNLFKKPMKTISVPEDLKEKIEDQIKL